MWDFVRDRQDLILFNALQHLNLVAQAVLTSGPAADGAFIIAIGGRAGQTCRLIDHRAPPGARPDARGIVNHRSKRLTRVAPSCSSNR